MGQSPSIKQMAEKEDEYRSYLAKLRAELKKRSGEMTADLDKNVENFYKQNSWTKTGFITGENADFVHEAEWSLKNVKNIIDQIGKAVFDSAGKLPEGVTVQKSDAVSKALGAMEGLEVYIAGKVFAVLSGIVESFGSATEITFTTGYKDEPIGNGFHLFASVAEDSYTSHDFFNNEKIIEYLYVYRVYFSQDEAKKQGNIMLTQLYEDQIQTFSTKVEELLTKLTNGKLTPEQYQAQVQIYNTLIEGAKKALAALGDKANLMIRAA